MMFTSWVLILSGCTILIVDHLESSVTKINEQNFNKFHENLSKHGVQFCSDIRFNDERTILIECRYSFF